MTALRSFLEIAMGITFAAGAVFNTTYTLTHGDEFYGSFAERAWLGPARWFMRSIVLPNARPFTVLLVLFQAAVAIMILTRGDLVTPALLAGAAFSVIAALASSPVGTVATLALAAIQAALALTR